MARKCKRTYNEIDDKKYGHKNKTGHLPSEVWKPNYQYQDTYISPNVSKCVRKSVENIINKGGKDTPYEISAFSPTHAELIKNDNGFHKYYLQWDCGKGPCSSKVSFYGYKEKDYNKFFGYTSANETNINNYGISDVCKWLNNPNSKYYYKKGWDYERLVISGKIADTPNNKKMVDECIPKIDNNQDGGKLSKYQEELPTKNKSELTGGGTITLTFKGGK